MLPRTKKPALKRIWEPLRCLILEEISMVSPALYNMLAYRSFLGRAERWDVEEKDYDQLKGAFGRGADCYPYGRFPTIEAHWWKGFPHLGLR